MTIAGGDQGIGRAIIQRFAQGDAGAAPSDRDGGLTWNYDGQ